MNIISYARNEKGQQSILVESEPDVISGDGNPPHIRIGKIRLSDVTVTPEDEYYRIAFKHSGLPQHLPVYRITDLLRAYMATSKFQKVPEDFCWPNEFPKHMIDKCRKLWAEDGISIESKEQDYILEITATKDGQPYFVFRAPMAEAYLDYIVSGLPRGKDITYAETGQRGNYGNKETEEFLTNLNVKLKAASEAIGMYMSYAGYTHDHFFMLAGTATGRSVKYEVPGCILNYIVAHKLELPFELLRDEDTFSMQVRLDDIIPEHLRYVMLNLDSWDSMRLIGLVA